MIPVVYIHTGTLPDYLIRSLEQTRRNNKEVVLIGDAGLDMPGIKYIPVSDLMQGTSAFDDVYEHMSTNGESFERICIRRWFILRNFMQLNKIEACYYTDSDVMIYDDMNVVYKSYSQYEACYTLPEQQENFRYSASACCSFWTKNAINEFCDFVVGTYKGEGKKQLLEKWNYHQQHKLSGGVCDMTLLYLFSKGINFFSLSLVREGNTFDQNMLDADNYYPEEYEMESPKGSMPRKKILWIDGKPYGFNKRMNQKVRFYVLTEYAKLLGMEKSFAAKAKQKIKSVLKALKLR